MVSFYADNLFLRSAIFPALYLQIYHSYIDTSISDNQDFTFTIYQRQGQH